MMRWLSGGADVLRRWRVEGALVIAVITIGVLAMPARLYRGDPIAVRFAAARLMDHGTLGIPYTQVPPLMRGFVQTRGQYFYANDEAQQYYSKFGTLTTVLALPPLVAERIFVGVPVRNLPYYERTTLLIASNIYNVIVSAIIAVYLCALAGQFTPSRWVALIFVMSTLYGSFLWTYLRAQTSEIFQVWFFLGFCVHLFQSVREGMPRRQRLHHVLAMAYGILLTLLKPYYGLVFPIAWAAAQVSPGSRGAVAVTVRYGSFALIAATIVLVENSATFGNAFDFGYSQWQRGGHPHDHIAIENIPTALTGFLVGRDRSIFTHAPLLLLAGCGVRRFWRRFRFEFVFICSCLTVFTLLIGAFSNWRGDWCYGPRYLVFVLPVAGVLAIPALEWMTKPRGKPIAWLGAASFVALTAFSIRLQLRVNALEFHANYQVADYFRTSGIPAIDEYFGSHSGVVFGDLLAFKRGKRSFPPLDMVRQSARRSPSRLESRLRSDWTLRSNYLLFPDRPTPTARAPQRK